MMKILMQPEHKEVTEAKPRKLGGVKAFCACALLAVLVITGCATRYGPAAPANAPSAPSSDPLLDDPQPPATPSPTQQPLTGTVKADPSPALRASPTPTLPPTPTATPAPTLSPTVTPIPTPSATPTPALRQLTRGNCCTQPFWSPDSRQVMFIDKPSPDLPTGIWGLDVTKSEPTPELFTERIAFYTPDLTLRSELSQDSTVIERTDAPLASGGSLAGADTSTETRWAVPSEGQPVSISPGQKYIAWQLSDDDLPFERRTTQVWIANLDGSAPQLVADLPRGGFSAWISDDVMLLSGRESLESQEQVLFTHSLVNGRRVELARGKRLRGGLLSPDGTWLAYFVALDEDRAQNGLWLVRSDGSERRKLERDLFGAYQWRDAHRLLIIPFQPNAAKHEIWELDANTGQARRLTDPKATSFKIANGDWTVSPDGRHVVFVESRDRNIWLLTLPD